MTAPLHYPKHRRLRVLALILGTAALIWLPVEDTTPAGAILFAAAICALAAARLRLGSHFPGNKGWLSDLVLGLLAGLAISPVTLLLMALKTGLHGHRVPDYTPGQMITVLQLTPAWAAAGLLVGAGVGVWRRARK